MIKQYTGYKPERIVASTPLPVGGYVLNIMKASVEFTKSGSQVLVINFDVAEGENAGWFTKVWKNDTREDKKWKGTYRLFIPTGDGSDDDKLTVRSFNNFVACLEESNPGYHWDWNEAGIKNLKIGGIWRNREYDFDGRVGWTTEMGGVATVDEIRAGTFKPLKDKPLAKKQAAAASSNWSDIPAPDDDDCPF